MEEKIVQAREELEEAQQQTARSKFGVRAVEQENEKRTRLRKWCELEEKILAQKSKNQMIEEDFEVDSYFHVIVNKKNRGTT